MKGSGTLVASMVAASTMALSSTSSSPSAPGYTSAGGKNGGQSSTKEKFEPRFDGLRFIETLVTAHR
uniref:uncharacterized protein LOC101298673 n=1 Tax=Fragaria vesca subsp. vesca TaxID=101020 RepID=UPI0005C838FA|nr:PREDICTED: uncharacterized protein LOC101298673 [Fragaria vesca subsp. vesca]